MNPDYDYEARLSKSYVRKEPKSEPKSRAAKRGKPLKHSSAKQDVRSAYLAGVKAERISHSYLLLGYVQCERCKLEYFGIGGAHQGLDLHHVTKRSQGQGYRPGKAGVDSPGNLELLCRQCHREVEKNEPEWSKSA